MNLFHNYLSYCFGNNVPACAFINLKKCETEITEERKNYLAALFEEMKDSDTLYKYPFLIGYNRHFRNYENTGTLLNEFYEKAENTMEYAEACFLALQMLDEMLYDEYRSLADVLAEVLKNLLQEGIDFEKGVLLLAALYFKYVGPEFIEFIPKKDFDNDFYSFLKEKVRERYPI